MPLSHVRVLAVSFAVFGVVGALGGAAYALATGRELLYGVATGLFLSGLVALALGLLGATEPSDGWATRRKGRRTQEGRRSVAARLVDDFGEVEEASSASLAVWAVVVGGSLVVLSMSLFARVS